MYDFCKEDPRVSLIHDYPRVENLFNSDWRLSDKRKCGIVRKDSVSCITCNPELHTGDLLYAYGKTEYLEIIPYDITDFCFTG